MKKKKALKRNWSPLAIVVLCMLVLYTVLLLLPLIWGILVSVKTDYDFRHNVFGIPKEWAFDNFPHAFFGFYVEVKRGASLAKVYMPEQFLNSVLYSLGCAFMATYVPCHMAYMTSKFKYKFSKMISTVVIICIALPIVGSLPSEISMARTFGLYNQIWGMWIMKAHFLSMYFFIFQGIFGGVPNDYTEAAKIDGASNLRIYLHIMLPLVGKTFLTVFLLNFIGFWNDYQTPLIFMPDKPTVAFGLYEFNRRTDGEFSTVPMKLAGSIIVLLPVLTVFIAFQKKLMGNIAIGGIK